MVVVMVEMEGTGLGVPWRDNSKGEGMEGMGGSMEEGMEEGSMEGEASRER